MKKTKKIKVWYFQFYLPNKQLEITKVLKFTQI